MLPEQVAASCVQSGLNRGEARRQLMNQFPTLIAAEIDKVLDIAYGTQREEPLERVIRRAERS